MSESTAYETYKQWKNWGKGPRLAPWLSRYFDLEISRAKPLQFTSVLEVGFGNGEFLQWAKERGAKAIGLEIIPDLVEVAAAQDFEVYHWNLIGSESEQSPISGRTFDCIVAFDVIEHLSVDQAKLALLRMAQYLNHGGKILLRFPNGESPFYLPLQNGDYTHRMDVTKLKLEHLALNSGLEVEAYFNSARVSNRRATAWIKWILFRVRDFVEIVVGLLYYNKRIPLDPAATAVLRLRKDSL